MTPDEEKRRRRWRLLLGEAAEDALEAELSPAETGMDRTLAALYDGGESEEAGRGRRGGGPGTAAPGGAGGGRGIPPLFSPRVVAGVERGANQPPPLPPLVL